MSPTAASPSTPISPPPPLLITAQQAADQLGVSLDMIRFAIRNGDLPARRLHPRGKSYYVLPDDVDRYARAVTRRPVRPPLNPR